MKNYVVITTLNQANEVFATFHKVEDMDVLTRAAFMATLSNATALDSDLPSEQGKIYYLESDIESDLESAMRTLGFRRCDSCNAWVTPQDRRTGASTRKIGVSSLFDSEEMTEEEFLQECNTYGLLA